MAQGRSCDRLLVVSCLQSAYDSKFSSCPWGLERREDGIPPAVYPPTGKLVRSDCWMTGRNAEADGAQGSDVPPTIKRNLS